MAVPVEVPNLGEDMAGGVVAEWYLADGSTVEPGIPVCRVESSFVAVEVEAAGTGLLRHQKPAGSIERPGAVLGVILAPGEAMPADQPVRPAAAGPVRAVAEAEDDRTHEPQPAVHEPVFQADDFVEPEAEFEEALAQSVVVPFPRRFQPHPDSSWDTAPGDAAAFESSLFGLDPQTPTDRLAEPGGSIPGLPLWEPEDDRAGAAAFAGDAQERFARISAEAVASAQVLTMSIAVDLSEANRMQAVCVREWRRLGAMPVLEDIIFRALALAVAGAEETGEAGGLVIAGPGSDSSCAIADPANHPFRDCLAAREAGGDAPFESAAWVLTSLAAFGITNATPRLDGGRSLAFAIGAADHTGSANLTVAYDSATWNESSAARLLARARDILEAPYAMLV